MAEISEATATIHALNERVVQHFRYGQHKEAVEIAKRAVAMAAHHLGREHPLYACSVSNLAMNEGMLCRLACRYDEAEGIYKNAITHCREALGEQHAHYATAKSNLSELYKETGRFSEALPLAEDAARIHKSARGERSVEYSAALNNLAGLYDNIGRFEEAERLFTQAISVCRECLGEHHPFFASVVNNLAKVYAATGHFEKAESFCSRAISIRRDVVGTLNPDYAGSVTLLADICLKRGDYRRAQQLYSHGIDIERHTVGEQHPRFATSLDNMGVLLAHIGDHEGARRHHLRSLLIRNATLGEGHPESATSLHNLASAHASLGDHQPAVMFFKQSMRVLTAAGLRLHPQYAASSSGLGDFYERTGNFEAAIPLYLDSLRIARNSLGVEHAEFAFSLANLARVHFWLGNLEEAEQYLVQATEIVRSCLGADHAQYAYMLMVLAMYHHRLGNVGDAERLYVEVAGHFKERGVKQTQYASCLLHLAELHHSRGDFTNAEHCYRSSLRVGEECAGEHYAERSRCLTQLAMLFAASDRLDEGLDMVRLATAVDDYTMGEVLSVCSEKQRLAFVDVVNRNFHAFLSIVLEVEMPTLSGEIFDVVLKRKAITGATARMQRDASLAEQNSNLADGLRELKNLRQQITLKTLAGPGAESVDSHEKLLAEWNRQREELEASLASAIPDMGLGRQWWYADRRSVATALPDRTALVEYVFFRPVDFKGVPTAAPTSLLPARYLAFVVLSGKPQDVRMIDLGEAEKIDSLIVRFRDQLSRPPSQETGAGAQLVSDGNELRQIVFDRVAEVLENHDKLLISPDGELNRLPFETLPVASDLYLIDEFDIGYLSCGRDLQDYGAHPQRQLGDPVVVADPAFNLTSDGTRRQVNSSDLNKQSTDLDRGRRFWRLRGTREEGEQVASMLGVEAWLGDEALEARLKQVCSPRVLHLATHGFFLENPKSRQHIQSADVGYPYLGFDRLTGPGMENPLLRSGLALAGANIWLRGGAVPEKAEDGLLTAEDVRCLDLVGTKLVVLSACETGLGEIRTGEGVFGLRRSFILAGAQSLVMSLWRVDDFTSNVLMVEFYNNLLCGKTVPCALSDARLAIRDAHPHPYFWGAFICEGDSNVTLCYAETSSIPS